jgi:hypothetical protein
VTLGSRWHLPALLTLVVLIWLPRLQGPPDLRYDGGVYYILGTSLAEGHGYRILSEPGAIEAIQYPPLLPAIGALHERLLGTTDPAVVGPWLRLTACAMYLAYVAAVYAMSRRIVGPAYALLVGLITAMHGQTVFISEFFTADVPFALVTALFFAVAAWRRHGDDSAIKPHGALEGLLAVAAYALRTAGVALLAAWIAESVLGRRARQTVIRVAVALAAVASWQLYIAHVKATAEYRHPAYAYQRADYQFYNVGYVDNMRYVDPFRPELGRVSSVGMLERAAENFRLIPLSIGEAVSEHKGWWRGQVGKWSQKVPALALPEDAADVGLALLSIPVAAGLVLLVIRGYWLFVLYTAGSVVLIALTPWAVQFSRYLVPLTPFLALALMYLIAEAMRRLGARPGWWRRLGRLAIAGGVSLILLQQVYTLYTSFANHRDVAFYNDASGRRHKYHLLFYDRTWRLHDDALDWLARHSRPGEIVATSTPHWAYLRTGLPAIMPPYEADPAVAQRLVDAVPVTYLVVDNLSFLDVGRRYTRPMIARDPGRWSLIYFANDTGPRIYRRVLGPAPVSASAATGAASVR